MTAADCAAANGSYRGNGTVCSNDICLPRGACCNPLATTANTNCVVTTAAVCANLNGVWHAGVGCDAAMCPPPGPRGACCRMVASNAASFCSILTAAQCAAAQGVYRGDGTACTPSTCVRACVCDWDHSGSITPIDLHMFLTDFLAGNADVNGDGHTDIADLNAFIDCYNHPPASCAGTGGGGNGIMADPGLQPSVPTPVKSALPGQE
jgi:hypothetical protein